MQNISVSTDLLHMEKWALSLYLYEKKKKIIKKKKNKKASR